MKRYIIRDREAGNEIDEAKTMQEAEQMVAIYEQADKASDIYVPNFYEIVEREFDTIQEQLKVIREEAGKTQEEVAGRIGIAQQTLSRIESCKHEVSLATAEQIIHACGCELVIKR